MVISKAKAFSIICAALVPLTAVEIAFISSNTNLVRAENESAYHSTLNSDHVPSLNDGIGSMVDDKNVTWNYSNAFNKTDYHVSLGHRGHFEVSSTSVYGYTGIESLKVIFSAQSGSELWLQTSVNGTVWSDAGMLESGTATEAANNWRYVRFYHYDTIYNEEDLTHNTVDITSVRIDYGCSGVSAEEDIDSAKDSNVIATSDNLTHAPEYSELSPNSHGGEAVAFTKTNNNSTDLTMGFGKTYKVGDVQNSKVEFDMKTANINYGKNICLMLNTSVLGGTIYSEKSNAYKCTPISGQWYHIEVPITTFISCVSGIWVNGKAKDKPHSGVAQKEFNGIKINAGSCVIDNLRITESPCDLGIFNNPTYNPTVGEYYWLKVAWVGKLYRALVDIQCSGVGTADHVPFTYPDLMNKSPFYMHLTGAGQITFTCTMQAGAERIPYSISFTVTIK